jgi:hypothetical protein
MSLAQYLQKHADITDIIASSGDALISKGITGAVVAPALLGAAAGTLVSKLTSPVSKSESTQKALVAAELEEALAEMERRKKLAIIRDHMKSKIKKAKNAERSLHF